MSEGEKRKNRRGDRQDREFDQEIIDIARVTRVTAGGKRMRFRAAVAVGDKKGQVGFAVGKGADVTIAVNKAATKAQKNLMRVLVFNDTIPYRVISKYKAAIVMLKPAPRGTGVRAGGAARVILELAGVPNVVGKIMGSKNKINNVIAIFHALADLELLKQSDKKVTKKEKKELPNDLPKAEVEPVK